MDSLGSPSQSPARPRSKRKPASRKPPLEGADLIGQRLGRYAISGQLGRGGMGIVYEAEDTLLQRRVAIKLLPKEVSSNPESLTRFLREAQAAARLNHANVVAVYDIGEADGTHYIVMELMSAGSAKAMLTARGTFHWVEATSILAEVCRGVAAAHKAGLIHRDIKPANILRSADGVVKLGDFGLVKPAGIKGPVLTSLGEVVGTPHYMSPEQSRCDALDKRSDIYSLGATYFALLTGRPPFDSPDSMQVLFAHCAHPVPDPRELVAEIPEACTAIIHKAMAKNRSERHRSAGELLDELEQVLTWNREKASDNSPPPAFVWSGTSATESRTSPSLASTYLGERSNAVSRWRHRLRSRIGWGIACTLVLAVLVVLVRNGGNGPQPSLAPEPPPIAEADWPTRSAEADRAIQSRHPQAMKDALDGIRIAQKREHFQEPLLQEAIRRTLLRLEKSLAFRESISEKGLVIGFDGPVTGALFSLDDHWLAVGQTHGDAGAFVFDSHTGEKRFTLWPRRGTALVRVQALAFDRDGTTLAALTPDNSVRIVHVATGKESTFNSGSGVRQALALAFSPTSRDLAVGLDAYGEGKGKPYLKAWNLVAGKEPFAFKAEHSARVAAVAFTADGLQIATGSHDKRVIMWNAETGRIWRELRTGLSIRAVACRSNGRMLAVAGLDRDGSVLQFWDYAGENLLAAKPSPHGPCNCVAFSRDGTLLASGSGSQVLLWNPETQTQLAALTGHSQAVTSVAFSADGTILATSSTDQTVRLWDLTRFPQLRPKP